jgi:amidase
MGVNPAVAAAVRRAGDLLAQAGYEVEEREPPEVVGAWRVFARLVAADLRVATTATSRALTGQAARRFVDLFLDRMAPSNLGTYVRDLGERNRIARSWNVFARRWPLIVAPVCTQPPFAPDGDLREETFEALYGSMRIVLAVNLLGLPAVTVPLGPGDGLPQAVQIIGPRFAELACLEAAAAIECAVGVATPIDPRTDTARLRP